MKLIIKSMALAVAMYVAGATAGSLSGVGDGTEPNQWTRNITGVLEAAKTTQLPIFLVMVNNGCSHCEAFIDRTLNSQEFASIVQRYRFYMVLLVKGNTPSELWSRLFWSVGSGDTSYPQVIVLKPGGTRHKGWSYDTTPTAVSPILYQYIEAALADLSTGTVTEPSAAETPTETTPAETPTETTSEVTPAATPTAVGTKQPAGKLSSKDARAKYTLFFFDGNDNIVASAQLKLTVSGTWNAKITEGGTTKTLKGTVMKTSDGRLATDSSELNVVRDSTTGIWSGSASGRRVYGRATNKRSIAGWKGAWNLGIAATASNQGGWVTATVGATGRITFSGKVSNMTRISGSCNSALLPAAFVSTYIPRWGGRGDVCFGYVSTRTGVSVGCALFSGDTAGGNVSVGSQSFDVVSGSRWDKSKIASLGGKYFHTYGAGNVYVPVVVSGGRVSAGANDYRARIRCTSSKGQVAVSYRFNNQTYKATGIIHLYGKALGGGNLKGAPFAFTVDDKAVDAIGGESPATTVSSPLDTTAPTPAPTVTGLPGALTNVKNFTLTATGSSDPNGVTYRWTFNGATAEGDTFDVTTTTDGAYSVSVVAVDDAGNESAATTVNWTLDTTEPPAPTVTGLPGALTNVKNFTLTATGSSDPNGVTYRWTFNGATAAEGPSFKVETTDDGDYSVSVVAVDEAGNESAATTVNWTLDTKAPTPAPTVTGAPPAPTVGGVSSATTNEKEIWLSASGSSDEHDGNDVTYRWTFNGATAEGLRFKAETTDDGVYSVSVVAVDKAGNESAPTTVSWTLDTTTP